ncbi:putative GAL4-like Zn(II)2Cys6 (or C6 zinc) binuclear cluster DNA-binding domain [Lyophyllum shimeji]|uniref:GAL4-like Zn(II)2Cys6 (Or C6 zinc) binuclear cluster DNA-binding domain n=1 Tax=Lyophyllum shimeji TaxID=47721 RepID=A0A9P3UND9_LYOSH|nr:putative GAL4-like Zn(II)2Cys6 (or C6 zinc) binuclear cluster DNA-binding domain [Lyophyllum shimeji]
MSDLPEEKEIIGDTCEDGQLTIRIPNPKVYMARQSLWIGRRGKPRCDHCRLNNLKCDRVLPACNHCSWTAGRECKYTPLPTPAHRGIPRCDSCRLNNLKCDRNLPVCNHCKDEKRTECNYTPKKRRKVPPERTRPSAAHDSAKKIEDLPADITEGQNFYGQNVASSSRVNGHSDSLLSDSTELPQSQILQTGRFTAELRPTARSAMPVLPAIAPKHTHPATRNPLIPLSYYPSRREVKGSRLVPWNNSSFAPLPQLIARGLRSINPTEIPDPSVFNESLTAVLEGVMPELRETSCLTPEIYTAVYRCLSRGDTSKLSPRLREWASYHHLCPGSDRYQLILVPRESIYQAEESVREAWRRTYSAHVDSGHEGRDVTADTCPPETTEDAHLFERLPVRDQIFDILTYAHISHNDSSAMLSSIKKVGFASITWPMTELYIRLCPTCTLRDRQADVQSQSAGQM